MKKRALRIKALRSYYLNYLRKHGILSEICDLLQGRCGKSVMISHYTKIDSMKDLSQRVLEITANIEESLIKQ